MTESELQLALADLRRPLPLVKGAGGPQIATVASALTHRLDIIERIVDDFDLEDRAARETAERRAAALVQLGLAAWRQ